MMDAFEVNDLDKFKSLVSKVKNINAVDEDLMTILSRLCFKASADYSFDLTGERYTFDKTAIETKSFIEQLLGLGAKINVLDARDRSPLSNAAHEGNYDLVKLLVELGADVNFCSDNGWGPIFHAISCDQVEIFKYLLNTKSYDKSLKANDMSVNKFVKDKKSKRCIAFLKEIDKMK